MGTEKLLLPFAGSTVLARVVDACLAVPGSQATVVVPVGDTLLRRALEPRRVSYVENPDANAEMLSSVRCGLRAAAGKAETFLVTPGDLPLLEPALLQAIAVAYSAAKAGILVPVFDGRRGHPLLFSARYREEALNRHDGEGLRGLVLAHPGEVLEWPAPTGAILEDVDTPEAYARCQSILIA